MFATENLVYATFLMVLIAGVLSALDSKYLVLPFVGALALWGIAMAVEYEGDNFGYMLLGFLSLCVWFLIEVWNLTRVGRKKKQGLERRTSGLME